MVFPHDYTKLAPFVAAKGRDVVRLASKWIDSLNAKIISRLFQTLPLASTSSRISVCHGQLCLILEPLFPETPKLDGRASLEMVCFVHWYPSGLTVRSGVIFRVV